MRVVFFTNQGLDSGSGIGRHIPIAKELVRRGHKVTILSLSPNLGEVGKRKEVLQGINVIYVGQMPVLRKGNTKIYFNKFKLIRVVFKSTWSMFYYGMITKTDIVYLCKPQPINSIAALLVRFLKNKKLILDYDDRESSVNNFSNKLEKKVFEIFEKNVPKFSNFITVNTLFLKEFLIKSGYPENKILYLSNGIDIERFKKDDKVVRNIKDKLKLKKKTVLYFGSLDLAGHPLDLLIRSFALLKKEISDVGLVIIGGGSDLEKLRKMCEDLGIKDDVIFLGRKDPYSIPNYVGIGDISVDPVNDDFGSKGRSPLKVFESMIMKVPVVTGFLGDRPHILENGKGGYLVKPGDEVALKEGMLRALTDPEVGKKVDYAYEKVKRYYWSNLIEEFDKVLS
jgi:glycosyltransferase involved in cell wall biosynthesis